MVCPEQWSIYSQKEYSSVVVWNVLQLVNYDFLMPIKRNKLLNHATSRMSLKNTLNKEAMPKRGDGAGKC